MFHKLTRRVQPFTRTVGRLADLANFYLRAVHGVNLAAKPGTWALPEKVLRLAHPGGGLPLLRFCLDSVRFRTRSIRTRSAASRAARA
jgi:hypothetical protein